MRIAYVVLVAVLLFSAQKASATYAPNVTLVYPTDGYATQSADITFSCNATDDESVYSVSLYHDIGGSFSLYDTNRTMGFGNDTDALLICGFDSSYTCLDGETGTASGTHFEQSPLRESVVVNDTDTLNYPANGNIGSGYGTIQMFLITGPEFDPYGSEMYLFSTGTSNKNKIEIWNNYNYYGILTFYFYDELNLLSWVEADISGWGNDEWHHVAAVWDLDDFFGTGNAIDLFIDGSNSSVIERNVDYYYASITSDLYMGSCSDGTGQSGLLIDDVAIYNRPLTETEIANSFNNLLADHSQEIVNWTVSNLNDGFYSWNCLTFDSESLSSWHSSNYTLIVDSSTPPSVVSISLNPDDVEVIDPGIIVNVTANVTDFSNVSHVVLMYKSPYSGIYTNDTMDYNDATGLWENGSIVTNLDEGNWSYRFWSNDTWGHSGLSDVYSLPVEKDLSWTLTIINSSGNVSDTFGSVAGFKGTVQNLGMIMINNTGDYTANFDFQSASDVSYNVTEPFDLSLGTEKHIEVNVTMPETPNEYVVIINITSTSVPSSSVLNGTAVSYIGGPYINESTQIASYPSSMPQSSSANFTARVKNIGNETASNVTLNWTLPYGMSLTYGNLSESLGDLSPYEEAVITVTAYANSSTEAGAATVWINSTSDEGTGGYDFKTIAISCTSGDGACGSGCSYLNDDGCEAPGGGTTSTRTDTLRSISVREPLMDVSAPDRIELTKGVEYNFTVDVRNDVQNTNLTGITLSIDGYPENLIRKYPSRIGYVSYGTSETFTLTVSVPPYLEEKVYIINLAVNAKSVYAGGTKSLEYTKKIIFSVHGVEETESLESIGSAEQAIEEMKKQGFQYAKLEGLLADARKAYGSLDFDTAEELSRNVVELKEKAFTLYSSIEDLEENVREAESYGIYVDVSKSMVSLAKSAFQRGDYERAESRLGAALDTYQLETKNMLGFILMVRQNWQYILVFLAAVILSSLVFRKKLVEGHRKGSLEYLRRRKQSVKDLAKMLNEEYYKRREMSKAEYLARKKVYEERLAQLSSDEMRLMRKMSKGSKNEKLVRAREDAKNRLKELQREYFTLGKTGKAEYLESVRHIQADIAEIERDMNMMIKQKKSKGLAIFMMMLLLLSFSCPAVKAAGNVTAADVSLAIQEAQDIIEEMESLGFSTERLNSTLDNSLFQLSRGEYDSALTNARYITVLRNKAVMVDGLLDEVELRIQTLSSQGLDVSEAGESFTLALAEFENENYEDAERLLALAEDSADKAERKAALEKVAAGNPLDSLVRSVGENKELAVFVSLALAVAAAVLLNARRKIRKERRIKDLEKSVEDVRKCMKELQDSYFNRQKISKSAYESRMKKYRNDLQMFMEILATEKLKKAGSTEKGR